MNKLRYTFYDFFSLFIPGAILIIVLVWLYIMKESNINGNIIEFSEILGGNFIFTAIILAYLFGLILDSITIFIYEKFCAKKIKKKVEKEVLDSLNRYHLKVISEEKTKKLRGRISENLKKGNSSYISVYLRENLESSYSYIEYWKSLSKMYFNLSLVFVLTSFFGFFVCYSLGNSLLALFFVLTIFLSFLMWGRGLKYESYYHKDIIASMTYVQDKDI